MKQEENNEIPRAIIFDTTLRDGEQSSGFHMLPEEKLQIAKQLSKLGVDIIEAGFAISSPGDFESINQIAKEVGTPDGPIICSLARAVEEDVEAAAKAIEPAHKKRIHTFIATSQIHIEGKFKKTKEWVIEQAVKAIKKAKTYVDDVQFSCEDFGRTDKDYTVEVVTEAINAGATTINLPDTVGWLTPSECYEKVKYVIEKIREKGLDAIFSVHNHNDFGMGTATSIEAFKAGARQIECTINGIGERAGNTSMEEIVAILKERNIGKTNINTQLIGESSKLLSKITKIYPQPNKAIVGKNAFAHEAGIHQHGVQQEKKTYETMNPEDYGVKSIITFGPRSGRNALKSKFESLNINLTEDQFQTASTNFINKSDKLKEVDDADIISSINNSEIPIHHEFISYHPIHNNGNYEVEVKIKTQDGEKSETSSGNGQVDAGIKAIKKLIQKNIELQDFKVSSESPGSDSKGITKITISKNSWKVVGKSQDNDVVTSSFKAFIDAINRINFIENYFKN